MTGHLQTQVAGCRACVKPRRSDRAQHCMAALCILALAACARTPRAPPTLVDPTPIFTSIAHNEATSPITATAVTLPTLSATCASTHPSATPTAKPSELRSTPWPSTVASLSATPSPSLSPVVLHNQPSPTAPPARTAWPTAAAPTHVPSSTPTPTPSAHPTATRGPAGLRLESCCSDKWTSPGQTAIFEVILTNVGVSHDSFDVWMSTALPVGWQSSFCIADTCHTGGTLSLELDAGAQQNIEVRMRAAEDAPGSSQGRASLHAASLTDASQHKSVSLTTSVEWPTATVPASATPDQSSTLTPMPSTPTCTTEPSATVSDSSTPTPTKLIDTPTPSTTSTPEQVKPETETPAI